MKYIPLVILAAIAVKIMIITITLPVALVIGFFCGLYAFHLYTQAMDPTTIIKEVENNLLKHQEDLVAIRAEFTHLKSQVDGLKLNTMWGKK